MQGAVPPAFPAGGGDFHSEEGEEVAEVEARAEVLQLKKVSWTSKDRGKFEGRYKGVYRSWPLNQPPDLAPRSRSRV